MPQITSYNDLKKFGFNPLTGESCNFSMRMLFDLSEEGKGTLARLLGLTSIELSPSWNNGEFSAGSFLMPRSMFEDLALFILVNQPDVVIAVQYKHSGFSGYTQKQWDEHREYINTDPDITRRVTPMYRQPNDRVTHAFTGRTA